MIKPRPGPIRGAEPGDSPTQVSLRCKQYQVYTFCERVDRPGDGLGRETSLDFWKERENEGKRPGSPGAPESRYKEGSVQGSVGTRGSRYNGASVRRSPEVARQRWLARGGAPPIGEAKRAGLLLGGDIQMMCTPGTRWTTWAHRERFVGRVLCGRFQGTRKQSAAIDTLFTRCRELARVAARGWGGLGWHGLAKVGWQIRGQVVKAGGVERPEGPINRRGRATGGVNRPAAWWACQGKVSRW
ncbi:hypothetical protein GCM10027456_59380 [Kineosporia babensis]